MHSPKLDRTQSHKFVYVLSAHLCVHMTCTAGQVSMWVPVYRSATRCQLTMLFRLHKSQCKGVHYWPVHILYGRIQPNMQPDCGYK